MNRQVIAEQQVLMRYLAGQLSDAEREAFEAHYVGHPQVLRELEVAAKLKLGLILLRDSGELVAPSRRHWQRGLAAAALLFVIVAVASWFATRTPAPPLLAASISALGESRQTPLLPADTYTIERTRSRGFDASVELPATSRTICLRVLPESLSATAYRLQLNAIAADAAPREIASVRLLRVDADGLVTVYASSERLQPGTYELILSGDSGRGAATQAVTSFLILIEPARAAVSSPK